MFTQKYNKLAVKVRSDYEKQNYKQTYYKQTHIPMDFSL